MFFEQFKQLCKEKNTTITAVTVVLGYSKGNIDRWRKGSSPTGDTLVKFADYFNVSIDYLLGRTDNPEVNR